MAVVAAGSGAGGCRDRGGHRRGQELARLEGESTERVLMEYTLRLDISVQYVFQNEFDLRLRPRLTTAARTELHS